MKKDNSFVLTSVLKAEAIKWVKEMLIKAQNDEEWIPIIREFYKFFNLTKEELK